MAMSGTDRGRSLSPPPLKKRKVESTTTKKSVSSFFTPVSKKEPEAVTWRIIHDSLLLGRYQPRDSATRDGVKDGKRRSRKIAAFDLDSTLIQTTSGNTFAKDATDWRWWHSVVPGKLKQLHADGYNVAILTNQGSITLTPSPKSKTPKAELRALTTFKGKAAAVLSHFDFPITLLAATKRDIYRKPRTGMWIELLEELDLDEPGADGVELGQCIFVGDAGGRAAAEKADRAVGKKPDHSCSDRDMAANVGINFHTPEEYFLEEAVMPFIRPFDPSNYLLSEVDAVSASSTDVTPTVIEKKNPLDIVIMCGSPGCGKSTFFWRSLKPLGYERVNQDLLKTREKCVKVATEHLDSGISVAVDNTNADVATRKVWLDLGAKVGVPVRCVWFTAPSSLCQHNDTVRALAGEDQKGLNPEKRLILPHSAFAGFRSRFKEPDIKEGFQDLVRIDFRFQGNEQERKAWSRYWI